MARPPSPWPWLGVTGKRLTSCAAMAGWSVRAHPTCWRGRWSKIPPMWRGPGWTKRGTSRSSCASFCPWNSPPWPRLRFWTLQGLLRLNHFPMTWQAEPTISSWNGMKTVGTSERWQNSQDAIPRQSPWISFGSVSGRRSKPTWGQGNPPPSACPLSGFKPSRFEACPASRPSQPARCFGRSRPWASGR